jgi:hypothetical protein
MRGRNGNGSFGRFIGIIELDFHCWGQEEANDLEQKIIYV